MQSRKNLIQRCLWSMGLLGILIMGQRVILPNVDSVVAAPLLKGQNSFLSILGSATGGQLSLPTLLSLGISPYMTGMVIWSALNSMDLDVINGLSVRARGLVQNAVTLVLAILQALGLVIAVKTALVPMVWAHFDWSPAFTVIVLIAGAMFSTWLAYVNSDRGIGGTVLMLIPGLVNGLPQAIQVGWGGTKIHLTAPNMVLIAVVTVVFVLVAVRLYQGELRIPIQRPMLASRLDESYLPIKILTAGAMPFMFSMMLFTLPKMAITSSSWQYTRAGRQLLWWTNYNTVGGVVLYAGVVILLGYTFGYINLQPAKLARQLKESGDYILDIVPGEDTEKYLMQKFWRLSSIGNFVLVLLSVTPLIVGLYLPGIANFSQYFGRLFIVITIFDNIAQQFRALYGKNTYRLLSD